MIKALKENPGSSTTINSEAVVENKFNEASPQRPEGDRQLDAALVEMNLISFREQIKKEKTWENSDRNAITLFKTDGMRTVLVALHAGAKMKTHTAAGIISVQILEGKITFNTELRSAELSEGQMLALHAGIRHRVLALKESVFLLTLTTILK